MRVRVERLQRRDVDHLGPMPRPRHSVSAAASVSEPCAPGDERDVAALAQHEAASSGSASPSSATSSRHRAVDALGFQKDHRIGIADRGQQQSVGARRRRRDDHPQAGNMGEHGLGAFASDVPGAWMPPP